MKRLMAVTTLATIVALGAAPAAAATRDRQAPTVSFVTSEGNTYPNSILGSPEDRRIKGKAYDRRSTVRRVVVEVKPCSNSSGTCEPSQVRADEYRKVTMWQKALDCGAGKHSCKWSIEAPGLPGSYRLNAWSYDSARNVSKLRSMWITVL